MAGNHSPPRRIFEVFIPSTRILVPFGLIIGAGPIGLSALEFVKLTGVHLTVMDISATRLEFCRRQYGIENTILSRGDGSEMEQILSITGGGIATPR